jgi:hypothetical protein
MVHNRKVYLAVSYSDPQEFATGYTTMHFFLHTKLINWKLGDVDFESY